MTFAHHYGYAFLNDTGFFTGNFGKGIAQYLGMFEPDIGDYGQYRGNDIGAVEPSAQAGFYYGDIHTRLCESGKGHGYIKLEIGRLYAFDQGLYPFYKADHKSFRYGHAIDADTFAQIDQVWRGVQTGFIPLVLQGRSDQVAGTAFAIGTGNMNAGKFTFRVIQCFA